MSRAPFGLDRVVTALVGLVLVALGLLALDWDHRVVGSYADTLSTGPLTDWTSAAWWPWAVGLAGLVLLGLGLWWLLAHARRAHAPRQRVGGAPGPGVIEVDLPSVASAVAARLEAQAPVSSARGTAVRLGGRTALLVTAAVDPTADGERLLAAARTAHREVEEAFDGAVALRVLLERPRRRATSGASEVRVE